MHGKCIEVDISQYDSQYPSKEPVSIPKEEEGLVTAQWSAWSSWSSCTSSCILKATGSKTRTRHCRVPRTLHTLKESKCSGSPTETQLCEHKCRAYKKAESFAEGACIKYRSKHANLARLFTGKGKQSLHDPNAPEQACSVFCQRKDDKSKWYTPRLDLHGAEGVDVHFPDGTHCYEDKANNIQYYCKNHLCVKERY